MKAIFDVVVDKGIGNASCQHRIGTLKAHLNHAGISLPIHDEVRGVAEILGIDPLYIANEGKLVGIVAAEHASRTVDLMRSRPEGAEAAVIGEVLADPEGMVFIHTGFGGTRVVDMLIGDPLPRIC